MKIIREDIDGILKINQDSYEFNKNFMLDVFASYHFTDAEEIKKNYMDKFEEKLFNLCFIDRGDYFEINKTYLNRAKFFDKDFMMHIENKLKGFL